ncbi:transcriptional regulator, TetR family [Geodermatophilus telluris]|uniref:Transcriptional regulator, TetR family n=1 Tax=Geodermatophilus telluris TaxID=1190417 RepID=A0A1G6T026_9ACTN|nr:TetR/AcrR family transcriptional regulator [Geodermatophilus telluris]SDD22540.1 transcriptional regulator, TetR family [Geodermatophilus telluris]
MPPAAATPPARERLLDAAGELFSASGIAATGVDAVLARARVSPATLYAHFAGKDDLVAASLERRFRRWQQSWDDVLGERTDPVDRLLSVFDAVVRFRAAEGSRRGCAFLAAATELPPGHPGHRWLAADSRLLTERLRRLAADAGAGDPTEVADGLLALYDGALARLARQAATPGLDTGDPVRRARRAAADWLAGRLRVGQPPG